MQRLLKKVVQYVHFFIDEARVDFIQHDFITAEYFAIVFEKLRRKGKPIPTNDIWITAVALQHGLAILTRDKHFSNIDGLIVVCI